MRVILPDSIFDGRIPALQIFRLLNFACARRHRVLAERGAAFGAWRASRSQDDQELYDEALHASEELEAREPSDSEIRVGDGGVAINEALERLDRPFLVFMENSESDRTFLEAVAATPYRKRLQEMYRKGWLTYSSLGGVSYIRAMITSMLKEFPSDAPRMFAIFDSDAPAPREPGSEPSKVAAFCEVQGVSYRMLKRRESENYLTCNALKDWSSRQSQPGVMQERVELLYGEWFSERIERRHHFDMKKGFKKMSSLHSIYGQVPPHVVSRLHNGFGSEVKQAFGLGEIREFDLRAEGAWDELSEVIEALVRSMR